MKKTCYSGWALGRLPFSVVTTDSHNLACRPPIPPEVRHTLAALYGQATALRLADFDPSKIFAIITSH
jgi:hypothetical protein